MLAAPPNVLAIAAADPTGGAGLQADILTLASLGCHPLSVLTALTVQDTHGVTALHLVPAAQVAAQARCVLADAPARAIKIGVFGSAENAQAIAAILDAHPGVPVVLDPVLASARGDALGDAAALQALRELLLPRATVATPNSVEARALGGAAALLALGCRHVLVTGAHEPGDEVVNVLHGAAGIEREDRWPRLPGSYHGSGCTLASALAARLAHGDALAEAVRRAQDYTWCALERGYRPGGGQHVPDRLHAR
ncbi:MAG: hydroxymethylpyrimidine/phosphomethylpyrimidine kinase [Betaproteobacteria bacterium]|nr:hydroxymethylpyrimidine/phosphomethylpyrimidine kinase [Betaproteobacteria bacterium]MDH4323624.1 hydroxymethylpyrimidine/phosphomethylpyrimidine kinase [Betaproteobacteria bacterium]MDH5576864.1 hydroxymethylpyrimidine/phosphomethylpyrimidine kinase [Betaproteobacteria bacterium]